MEGKTSLPIAALSDIRINRLRTSGVTPSERRVPHREDVLKNAAYDFERTHYIAQGAETVMDAPPGLMRATVLSRTYASA
jgi:hypothetical protein